jgi:hypothetical protein
MMSLVESLERWLRVQRVTLGYFTNRVPVVPLSVEPKSIGSHFGTRSRSIKRFVLLYQHLEVSL